MDDAKDGLRGLRAKVSEPLLGAVQEAYELDFGSEPVDLGG